MKWWGENKCDLDAYIRGSENIEADTWEYFRNTDRKWYKWHHQWACTKFPILHKWIDFNGLKGKKVLEVGCGVGTMFEQFSGMGAEIHGLDLNLPSCETTWKRTELFKLSGCVYQGDAENLPFKDKVFDFVFSYGVLHHTPDIQKTFDEIYRVLKPGGKFLIMLYNKDSINYWWHIIFLHGILRRKLLKMNPSKLSASRADRYYQGGPPRADFLSKNDLKKRLRKFSKIEMYPTGTIDQVKLLPWSKLPLGKIIPDFMAKKIVHKFGILNFIKGVK
jgi:ubiquinone/menaquinone biosynthesis C-methylase UbiE